MTFSASDQPPTGRFAGLEHRLGLRVYFEDTDLSGVVYHANYLRYMERARSDMLRLLGVDQRGAVDAGEGAYAVSDLAIRYLLPARLDDALVVASRVSDIRAAACRIHQRVMRGDQLLTEAHVTAVFVSPGGKAKRQPAAWVEAFKPYLWNEDSEAR